MRYYLKNRDKRIAASRCYKLQNHEHWLEYQRRWNRGRRAVDVHIPDIDSWQRQSYDSARHAIEALQALLPNQLADAIDLALTLGDDDPQYWEIVAQVKKFLDKEQQP